MNQLGGANGPTLDSQTFTDHARALLPPTGPVTRFVGRRSTVPGQLASSVAVPERVRCAALQAVVVNGAMSLAGSRGPDYWASLANGSTLWT